MRHKIKLGCFKCLYLFDIFKALEAQNDTNWPLKTGHMDKNVYIIPIPNGGQMP